MRRRRVAGALVALLVVAGLIAGAATGLFAGLVRDGLYATGLWSDGGAPTLAPGRLDPPASGAPPQRPSAPPARPAASSTSPAALPPPVLAAAAAGPAPRASRVAAAVEEPDAGAVPDYAASVVDVGSGKVLYARRAARPYIPASTMKLLTSAAALSALGPEHRFATRVVSARRGEIVLVGGGDPYLTSRHHAGRASVADLAESTARVLRAAGQRRVSLRYDASLFTGPSFAPSWPASYGDQVAPVSALWVDQARAGGGRVDDSPRSAAAAFAAALKRQGVRVTTIKAGRASSKAAPVASVASMPLERIVEALLMASDNDAAEVVFRHAAVASGQPGSFIGGQRAVKQRLRDLGVWQAGTEIHDGSGLSRETRVAPTSLAALLRLAAGEKHPELRGMISGLPVAGVEGSLRHRFTDEASAPGRGLVRGKTGTLRDVHALAGYVRSVDGSLLVYAFVVAKPRNAYLATVWLDQVTAALSQCGCR